MPAHSHSCRSGPRKDFLIQRLKLMLIFVSVTRRQHVPQRANDRARCQKCGCRNSQRLAVWIVIGHDSSCKSNEHHCSAYEVKGASKKPTNVRHSRCQWVARAALRPVDVAT